MLSNAEGLVGVPRRSDAKVPASSLAVATADGVSDASADLPTNALDDEPAIAFWGALVKASVGAAVEDASAVDASVDDAFLDAVRRVSRGGCRWSAMSYGPTYF